MTNQQPPRTIHQPIHPDVRPLLDPEYVAFHDTYFQYIQPDDQKTWDGSARSPPTWIPRTESTPVEVGNVRDLDLTPDVKVRVFVPELSTPPPPAGFPILIWFHGGGWAVGGIAAGNDLCALVCRHARAIVVTVGYRLAPEHVFPAANEDAMMALEWVCGLSSSSSSSSSSLLSSPSLAAALGGPEGVPIDINRVAVGGTSAGGQMAAVLAMKAAAAEVAGTGGPVKKFPTLAFQLLVVPVIDNTATVETSACWAERPNAPWLTPKRMEWYRRMYFAGGDEETKGWEASPSEAPLEVLARSPRTWIGVSEQDLLAGEGKRYAEQLRGAWKEQSGVQGREVVVKEYEGSTHSIMAMSGILKKGRQLIEDVAEQARLWFEYEGSFNLKI